MGIYHNNRIPSNQNHGGKDNYKNYMGCIRNIRTSCMDGAIASSHKMPNNYRNRMDPNSRSYSDNENESY